METAVMKLNNSKFLALFLLGFTCNERDNWSIIYQHDLLCFYWVLPVMKETTGQSYINMI
jgi:hypothetical protein